MFFYGSPRTLIHPVPDFSPGNSELKLLIMIHHLALVPDITCSQKSNALIWVLGGKLLRSLPGVTWNRIQSRTQWVSHISVQIVSISHFLSEVCLLGAVSVNRESRQNAHSKAQGALWGASNCRGPACASNQWSHLIVDLPQHLGVWTTFGQSWCGPRRSSVGNFYQQGSNKCPGLNKYRLIFFGCFLGFFSSFQIK